MSTTTNNVRLTSGTGKVSHRTAGVHPGHWDGKLDKLQPMGDFPLIATIDKMKEGEKAKSVEMHFFQKPYNALVGDVEEVYADSAFATPYASGPAAIGTTVVIQPAAASAIRLHNIRRNMQVEIHSAGVNGMVKGLVVAVEPGGAKPSFTITTLTTDSKRALEGADITWCLGIGSEDEVFELSKAVNEHEIDMYNYMGTDSEPFALSRRELREYSRILEDKKKEKELEALARLNWRREYNILEGIRHKIGENYWAGGLRFFLETYESYNIRDWETDHNRDDGGLSSSKDKPLGGTLPFLNRCFQKARPWSRPGASKVLETSSYVRGFINECVRASTSYEISYGTNKYGVQVQYLKGLDQEIEIWENPQLDHIPSKKRTAYLLEPEHFKRHTPEDGEANASKGLEYVPWSTPKKANGENFKSRAKGGWISEETYTFRRLPAHMIIDNLGLPKSA